MSSNTPKIVQKDTSEGEVLREIAKPVDVSDIKGAEIKKVLEDMRSALYNQEDGVALAAPQIGVSLRIFVVAPKAFSDEHEDVRLVFINPEIIKHSKDNKLMEEGCLSVRPWYGKIRRHSRATVRAMNEKGEEFEIDGSGLLAQIFQHEIDHLDGVLFSDNAINLKEIPPAS